MRESKIGPLISFYHKSMQATRDVHVLADKLISIFPIKTNPSRLASWTRKVLKSNDTYSGKKWDVVHHPLPHSLQHLLLLNNLLSTHAHTHHHLLHSP